MKISNIVFQWLRLPKPASIVGTLEDGEVERLFPKGVCKVSDDLYMCVSVESLMRVVKLDRFRELEYSPGSRDCDDFSFALLGLVRSLLPGAPFGFAWVEVRDEKGKLQYYHSLNVFVTADKEVLLIEPQTGRFFSKPKNWVYELVVI
jgi:hypothetical protein